jgi:hypothetical protein
MISEKNNPSLLVLAAGMGSRYGGLKQVDPVGPNGETLMDYSLHDAIKAGFSKVVFLIREEMHEVFHQQIGSKYEGKIDVEYAYQSINDLPEEVNFCGKREKPWGTGHAVWCARNNLAGSPFAVINADDFYGAATFQELITSISQFDHQEFNSGKIYGSIVGYYLNETLSDHGKVSRGICKINENLLSSVEEWSGIARSNNCIHGKDAKGNVCELSGDEIVSMNVWAFPPEVFSFLTSGIVDFFANSPDLSMDEFYLPAAVDNWISEGNALFQAGLAKCKWLGVTYREDKPVVAAAIAEMISKGEYPESLF